MEHTTIDVPTATTPPGEAGQAGRHRRTGPSSRPNSSDQEFSWCPGSGGRAQFFGHCSPARLMTASEAIPDRERVGGQADGQFSPLSPQCYGDWKGPTPVNRWEGMLMVCQSEVGSQMVKKLSQDCTLMCDGEFD